MIAFPCVSNYLVCNNCFKACNHFHSSSIDERHISPTVQYDDERKHLG